MVDRITTSYVLFHEFSAVVREAPVNRETRPPIPRWSDGCRGWPHILREEICFESWRSRRWLRLHPCILMEMSRRVGRDGLDGLAER